MIRFFSKKTFLLIGMLLAFTVFFACNREKTPSADPTVVPTQEITSTPSGTHAPTEAVTPTQEPSPTSGDLPVITDDPVPTLMENTDPADDDNDGDSVSLGDLDKNEPTGAEGDDDGDELDDNGSGDKSHDDENPGNTALEDFRERRAADWQDTFLARIPEFTDGIYNGYTPEDTFDRAIFAGTSIDEVRKYIELLAENGFVHGVEANEHENAIIYTAADENNWIVELDYSAGFVSIGSGYRQEDKTSPEYVERVWMTTGLSNLPVFTAGTFGSDAAGTDGSHNIVYENVDADDIRLYIAEVKAAGFIVDPDEGDSDGFIWYMAENADEISCSITFYDGVIRIGCGG